MDQVLEVKTADFATGEAPQKLITHGIGSCIVVCFYSSAQKIGALGHFMLPKAPTGYSGGYRYVDYSLDVMLSELIKKGVDKNRLIVSVIGGAQMFKILESPVMSIGQRNIEEAKNWLSKNGLGISFLDTGGNVGRNVEFDLQTGIVKVTKNV